MKGPGPRTTSLIDAASNVVVIGGLFFTYVTAAFRNDPQFTFESGRAWEPLFPDIDSVPLWYRLLSALLILSIVFPLAVHLLSLKVHVHRQFFLWSSLIALVGVILCLLIDYVFLFVTTYYGSTEFYTLGPEAWLLLLGLCASSGCCIYRWKIAEKISP